MLKIHSFFTRFFKLIKSMSKKMYRNSVVITTSMAIVAVISLSSTDFGGSGKNRVVSAGSVGETIETEYEDEESAALSNSEETTMEITTAESTTVESTTVESTTTESTDEVVIANNSVPTTTSTANTATSSGIQVSAQDYDALCRIVQAEAGGEDEIGKILVANVILNRVKSEIYPDTITDVIYDRKNGVQFQPTSQSRFETIQVSDSTKACVDRALAGEDHSQGAMYFAVKTASTSWFNTELQFLFVHQGHYFYK
jgi:N-acetylmuramoyl-L-alanine amidase